MGKEVKIGLAVIGVLLCVFGGVLAMRLKKEQPSAQEKVVAAEKEGKLIGKKKQVEKPGKERQAEDGPSLGAQLESFASRSRRDKPASKTTTDRYGRPVDDEESTTPFDEAAPSDVTEVNPIEAPDARRSPYGNRNSSNGNRRNSDDNETALDGTVEDGDSLYDDSADDVSMPADRFVQPNGGLSFSDGDDADDGEPADETDDQAGAPRFSMQGPADRYPADSDATNDANADEPDVAGADVQPAQELGADVDLSATVSDDDRGRTNTNRAMRNRRLVDAAETADSAEAPEDISEETDDQPRRLTQLESESYAVEPNDNFWRISQKVYGTGAYYKALEAHNRRMYGKKPLGVGDQVSVPTIGELQQEYPGLSPQPRDVPDEQRNPALADTSTRGRRLYTVAEGETVFDIARRELGKASRWSDIYALNRDQLGEDLNNLSPGMEIELPARSEPTAATATRTSRDRYQR